MAREHEIKLLVPDEFEIPELHDLCAATPSVAVEQTATYYDTADLRLSRAGASLRYRSDDGWTVKLAARPASGSESSDADQAIVRSEFVFGGQPGSPPQEALGLVAALTRTARLAPAARLHTARRRSQLHGVGTLTDDDCTVLEGRVQRRFRELELELNDDAPSALVADVVARFRDSGAGDPDPVPKVVRALGPEAEAPSDIVPYSVGSPATVDAVIRHAISESVARLIENDPVVRIGEDPEGVHQARVATRRLRSHLRTFRTLLEPEWAEQLRDELGWLGSELGAVRDADVLLERLQRRIAALENDDDRVAAAPLLSRLISDREDSTRRVARRVAKRPLPQLLDRLVDAAHRPRVVMVVGMDHAETLRSLVARAVASPPQRSRLAARSRTRRRAARRPHPREARPLRRRGGGAGVREAGAASSPR